LSAQFHRSDPRILGRRTLERDHRRLAELLRPGLSVLDVGCGTGAITAGIANAVGPAGRVVGIDRDEALLRVARSEHAMLANLRFDYGDVGALSVSAEFDIVTAARTLQWIADPASAVSKMKGAAKPTGLLVVLDYNHSRNEWEPDPPSEFQLVYRAFLAWRESNGWDNEIATRLPDLLRNAGLSDIRTTRQDEVVEREQPEFASQATIWSEVLENVGDLIVRAGLISELQLQDARTCYQEWSTTTLRKQTLAMLTVTGVAP